MSNENNTGLILEIDDAVVLCENEGAPFARLKPTVRLNCSGDGYTNVGAGNFEFLLNSDSGIRLTKLEVESADDFKLKSEGMSEFTCRLNVADLEVEPNKTYILQVNAFGKTQAQDFEFA